ncbi:MAG: DUF7521 family protein [Halohasta sp.]
MAHTTADSGFLQFVLLVVKVLMVVAGGSIVYYATKAYRRSGDESLGYLAGGFGLVLVGSILAGLVYEFLETALIIGVIVESGFVLAGFVLIAYSLKR